MDGKLLEVYMQSLVVIRDSQKTFIELNSNYMAM